MKMQSDTNADRGPAEESAASQKPPVLPVFLLIFGLNILTGAVLSPIYLKVSSDVLFQSAYLADFLYYLIGFVNIAALFVGYGSVAYAVCAHSLSAAVPYGAIAIGGLLLNDAVSFVFDYFGYVNGMPPEDILAAGAYFGINLGAELLKILLIALFAARMAKKHGKIRKGLAWQLYRKGHPLFSTMLLTALLFTIIAALNELPTTIDFLVAFWGDIRPNEVFAMVYTYASLVLSGAIGYFVMLFSAMLLDRRRAGNNN